MGDKTLLIVQIRSPKDLGLTFMVFWYWLLFFTITCMCV